MSKMKSLVAVAVAAGLLLTGIAPSHAAGKTLTLGAITQPVNMSAALAESGNNVWYYQAIYDTLLHKDLDGTLRPSIATKWSYNVTNSILTLTLRKGIKFTDGTALDAKAVVANLIANRDGKGSQASLLSAISTATAQNATTVILELKAPDPALLEALSGTVGSLESPKLIGTPAANSDPIGSGPYILDKANTQIGSNWSFKANPNYWDKGHRSYENFNIKFIFDATAMNNALQSGAVQGANLSSNNAVATMKAAGFSMASGYLNGVGIYFSDRMGKQVPALADVRVRQAINYVFDKDAMINLMENGVGRGTSQIFPKGSKGYVAALDDYYTYDVAKAKSLMAAAGYANGFSLTMSASVGKFGAAPYAAIKAQLGLLNITVNQINPAPGTMLPGILAGKYPAYLMSFEESQNAWTLINFIIAPNSIWNVDHFADATSNALLSKIQSSGNSASGIKAQQDLNTYMVKNAWFAPFYAQQGNFAYKGIKIAAAQAGNAIPFLYNIH